MDLTKKRALVTGASSGIGEQFARQLAARGVDLVITARREERLEKLAAELREAHSVEVTPIPLDLSAADAPKTLFEKTAAAGQPVDILINNAGYAIYGPFADTPFDKTRNLLQLNILALSELTHRFLGPMRERNYGWILNVASFVAYLPVGEFAAYSASKAYVRNFSEAVAAELKKTNVRVCSLCPGAVATEFLDVAGQEQVPGLVKATMDKPDKVARIGLAALFRGRRNIVAGVLNKTGAWFMRFLPRRLLVWIASKVLSK